MSTIADRSIPGPRSGRADAKRMPRVAVIGTPTRATDLLVGAWLAAGIDASVLTPALALTTLEAGDVALFRLDVLPTLDGVEPGFDAFPVFEERGVLVLNRPEALLAAHDKLRTAAVLAAAGLRHPRTLHVTAERRPANLPLPCVVKPRFGSWGTDVVLCRTRGDLDRALAAVSSRPWWRRHGALVQELVPPAGRDLAGVDLLPCDDGWVVLELNGAVDFDERYALGGRDLYREIARALALPGTPQRGSAYTPMTAPDAPGTMRSTSRKETMMSKTVNGLPAEAGDLIQITGHVVGDAPRNAEILEVLGQHGHEHYRVRWEDSHESIYFPADDAVITRPKA